MFKNCWYTGFGCCLQRYFRDLKPPYGENDRVTIKQKARETLARETLARETLARETLPNLKLPKVLEMTPFQAIS